MLIVLTLPVMAAEKPFDVPSRLGKSTVMPGYQGKLSSVLVVYQALPVIPNQIGLQEALDYFQTKFNPFKVASKSVVQDGQKLGVLASKYDQQLLIRPVRMIPGDIQVAEFGLVLVDRQETIWVSNVYLPLNKNETVVQGFSRAIDSTIQRLQEDGLLVQPPKPKKPKPAAK